MEKFSLKVKVIKTPIPLSEKIGILHDWVRFAKFVDTVTDIFIKKSTSLNKSGNEMDTETIK